MSQVYVLNTGVKREQGRKAQLSNIAAGKAIADIIRSTLGPKSMLKMILDPMGGIVLTSDGNAILREIDVSHPAAKSIIELSRVQDDQVGDGTTSVIVLAGEMLTVAEPYLHKHIHPTDITQGYFKALDDAINIIDTKLTMTIDPNNVEQVSRVVNACVGTTFMKAYSSLMTKLAIRAVNIVSTDAFGKQQIDTKRYAKVEKIPGGEFNECRVMNGVMLNKDITHSKMRRRVVKPRILLLDCPLEYKKGESITNIEVSKMTDWNAYLQLEEETVKKMCNDIIKFKPDIVFTEKGMSDLAQHFFVKAGITGIRRLRKTDNNRIARAVGATICHSTEDIKESDIGTECGLFEIRKIGDQYFTFIEQCKNPKACTIVLRGASKDILNEIERNLHDAIGVVRNTMLDPRVVYGGGAVEMAVSQELTERAKSIEGLWQYPYQSCALALECIPRQLAKNCGADVVRLVTKLRHEHSTYDSKVHKNRNIGINGITGKLDDMEKLGLLEPYAVKVQTIKTAIESACMLLRIDEVVSGMSKKEHPQGAVQQ